MAQTARKAAAGNLFAAALKQTKTEKKSTKKSSVPTLADVPEAVGQAVDDYLQAAKAEKEAKAQKECAGETIIEFVRVRQDEDAFAGSFRHSYSVTGLSGSQVKFVSSNRFVINAEDAEQIQEILGDRFNELIEQTFEVKLRPEVFANESLQNELMELIGDRFAAFFETTPGLKVAEEFDRKIYDAVKKDSLPILRTFVRQYKPSLRGGK